MGDLISRNELLKHSRKVTEYDEAGYSRVYRAVSVEDIKYAPTVEAKEVVHGEWKRIGSGSLYDTYECTNCHRPPKWDCLGDNHWRIAFTDFCPNCGADMRKKVE